MGLHLGYEAACRIFNDDVHLCDGRNIDACNDFPSTFPLRIMQHVKWKISLTEKSFIFEKFDRRITFSSRDCSTVKIEQPMASVSPSLVCALKLHLPPMTTQYQYNDTRMWDDYYAPSTLVL